MHIHVCPRCYDVWQHDGKDLEDRGYVCVNITWGHKNVRLYMNEPRKD